MKNNTEIIGAELENVPNKADVIWITRGIMDVLRSEVSRVWSWGADEFCAVVYDKKPALRFTVEGFLFTGRVVVALNEGADLYEVYCLDNTGNIVKSQTDVYCFDLMDVIDRMVEKECDDETYDRQVASWLGETAIYL